MIGVLLAVENWRSQTYKDWLRTFARRLRESPQGLGTLIAHLHDTFIRRSQT